MTATPDPVALTLTQALKSYDLDTLLNTLTAHGGARATKQRRANLVRVFRAAESEHINLLVPPDDFHPWLRRTLTTNENGTPAKPNSVVSRLSALRTLYRDLRAQGLLYIDPLLDYAAPSGETGKTPLPTRADIEALIAEARAQKDAALTAALLLLTHHAVQVTEILTARWSAYQPESGTLLRHRTATRLDDPTLRALDDMLAQQGGPMQLETFSGRRIFPYDSQDALRLRIFQSCQRAGLAFLPPSGLRRSALRDYPLQAADAGFSNPLAFERAVTLARQAVGADDPTPEAKRRSTRPSS
ncbi:hypothetical protein E7T09_09530 [Deinococcus sp. KSM4-11]|uniref:hypothetical protein n=1 Tax=Deinococcus sp. KSM4-11 TaxID=2568654 RepID=UPI0010A533E8|nr:hypothetical protein [Deinococcus sp. KSM4-11]THF87362.1 hypothetical protein E7T09_09530 [Deinococcus sp. KSM4-11]